MVHKTGESSCPKELAEAFAERVRIMGAKHPVFTVFANCEYEAWFLASLETVGMTLGLPEGLVYGGDVEAKAGVKGWLSGQLPSGHAYKETVDQAAMTSAIDLTLARERSRSFRRLCHAVEQALWAIDNNQVIVTPFGDTPQPSYT